MFISCQCQHNVKQAVKDESERRGRIQILCGSRETKSRLNFFFFSMKKQGVSWRKFLLNWAFIELFLEKLLVRQTPASFLSICKREEENPTRHNQSLPLEVLTSNPISSIISAPIRYFFYSFADFDERKFSFVNKCLVNLHNKGKTCDANLINRNFNLLNEPTPASVL